MSEPLRVLIAGAGIGGVATAIALTRLSNIPNLDIQLYEQAPELQEIGASIALSPNGLRTLEKVGVTKALSDEVGFRGPSGIPQIFRHWKTNQVVSVDIHANITNPRHQTTRFHRGHLHNALLEHVPRSWIHLNKKIERAEADDNGVTLFFEDGTTAHGDVLIGADGIRSKVRQSFYPDYELKFSGKVFMRAAFDASLVEGKVPDLPPDAIHWWSPDKNFFASKLGHGQFTTVGWYSDPRTHDELSKSVTWNSDGDIAYFRELYKDWNPVVKRLTELTPSVRLFPNYSGGILPSWVPNSRVALLGDAAHTHGGAFAAGGSLALDDAFALGLAFKHAGASKSTPWTATDLRQVFELYDETRRPHASRLLKIVHGATSAEPVVYNSPEEEDEALIKRMTNRPDTTWLAEHNVEQAFSETLTRHKIQSEL